MIQQMLEDQGDMLDENSARATVVRLAQEVWEDPPPPIEVNIAAVVEYLLQLLRAVDEESWFAEPVTESAAPGYMAAIRFPMDFGTIAARAASKAHYRSAAALQDDLVLVFGNCLTYNAADTQFAELAESLANHAGQAYDQALDIVAQNRGWGRGEGGGSRGGRAGGKWGSARGRDSGKKRGRPPSKR